MYNDRKPLSDAGKVCLGIHEVSSSTVAITSAGLSTIDQNS